MADGGSSSFDAVAHIAKLYEEICSIRQEMNSRSRGRSPSSSRSSRPLSRASSKRRQSRSNQPGVCWYHRRYGAKAQKCTRPCTFDVQQSGN
uniref:Uncharacterized protein n=1 Tax=Trichobilharzia regenti TaxID=157069 RepID=A0AA85IPP6_TRIRE|nr:unnamed protein product [Trichobilharzia regenti]